MGVSSLTNFLDSPLHNGVEAGNSPSPVKCTEDLLAGNDQRILHRHADAAFGNLEALALPQRYCVKMAFLGTPRLLALDEDVFFLFVSASNN